jgi:hypothetical protein
MAGAHISIEAGVAKSVRGADAPSADKQMAVSLDDAFDALDRIAAALNEEKEVMRNWLTELDLRVSQSARSWRAAKRSLRKLLDS